ncbi:hypothetical protein ACQY0O_006332 [Thecaphora frezii]
MKYLEYPELELLSRALTFESAECKVFTRLEAYSCKTVTKEKRLFKSLESSYLRSASTSPPDYLEEALASPFGRLDQPSARKTLFLLIATLNVAFPDHDFSEVNPADFRREVSPALVLNSLSTTLLSLKSTSNAPRSYSSFPGSFEEPSLVIGSSGSGGFSFGPDASRTLNLPPLITHPALSSILDDIMNVSECEVFTFHPDMDSDPHASAEPEEEGDPGEDDPYDDGYGYWDGDDADMRHEGTPRPRDSDEEMMDAPMFDEDVYGAGLGGGRDGDASATSLSSGPRTPANHDVRLPARAYPKAGMESSSLTSYSSYDDPARFDDEDDDLDGTGAGLLWSTFAFFYNRKMKRVLFVSVWSRKNPRFGLPGHSWGYPQPTTMLGPSFSSPPPTTSSAFSSRIRSGTETASGTSADARQKKASPSAASPAKRAIARTDSINSARAVSTRGRHSRAASGSPAPSALSPFPHASPQAPARKQDGVQPGSRLGVGSKAAAGTFASLDGAILSASAPAKTALSMSRPKRGSEVASGAAEQKRARKQAA